MATTRNSDGYYVWFPGERPQVALKYALTICHAVAEFNGAHARDLPLRVLVVLSIGDLEQVEDQFLSEAMTVAERLISYDPFKRYAQDQESPAALAITSLFHLELQRDLDRSDGFPELTDLTWRPTRFVDSTGDFTTDTFSARRLGTRLGF